MSIRGFEEVRYKVDLEKHPRLWCECTNEQRGGNMWSLEIVEGDFNLTCVRCELPPLYFYDFKDLLYSTTKTTVTLGPVEYDSGSYEEPPEPNGIGLSWSWG